MNLRREKTIAVTFADNSCRKQKSCRVSSAAAVCSVTSFAPQAIKIWKERDASSVSLKTYSLTVCCFVLWTVYGVMIAATMIKR